MSYSRIHAKIPRRVCQSVSCPFSKIQRSNIFLLLSLPQRAWLKLYSYESFHKSKSFGIYCQRQTSTVKLLRRSRHIWAAAKCGALIGQSATPPSVSQPASDMARWSICASSIIHSSKLYLSCKS